jgi:hypothetical protein
MWQSFRWRSCLIGILGFCAVYAQAPPAPLASFTGVYVASGGDDIEAAIDENTATMNVVSRSFARGIIRKRHPAYQRIGIAYEGVHVVVTLDAGNPMRMPNDGSEVAWRREDGEILRIKVEWRDQRMVQTIKTNDVQRVNTFSLSPDGQALTLDAVATGGPMPAPLSYRLSYRRASSPIPPQDVSVPK